MTHRLFALLYTYAPTGSIYECVTVESSGNYVLGTAGNAFKDLNVRYYYTD